MCITSLFRCSLHCLKGKSNTYLHGWKWCNCGRMCKVVTLAFLHAFYQENAVTSWNEITHKCYCSQFMFIFKRPRCVSAKNGNKENGLSKCSEKYHHAFIIEHKIVNIIGKWTYHRQCKNIFKEHSWKEEMHFAM